MDKKIVASIVFLLITNAITLFFLLKPEENRSTNDVQDLAVTGEVIAGVGEETISREEWLHALEIRYGREVLEELVDKTVIEEAGKKFGVSVSEKEVDQELAFIQSIYNSYDEEWNENDQVLREQIYSDLLLQKLATKDVEIQEEELKRYYEQNEHLYVLPSSYLLSMIFVPTKKEAEQTQQELNGGSSFEALAIERSTDPYSAQQGGSLGYVIENNTVYPTSFWDQVQKLSEGEWSDPFSMRDGYAIVLLHEKNEGKEYSFKEVKEQIHRQIALEQQEISVSPKSFYEEFNVESFYETEEQ
ncbi:peptidyl-prolyl cis-trans isomerase [Bacillus sp. 2205SS5-2]|uniref:peptidyl-prolyl cis-trans isomerase n=1 Tax=Bacillus sp. 2205SS5-2 TaxID=3109031 RepID=UPI003007A3D1